MLAGTFTDNPEVAVVVAAIGLVGAGLVTAVPVAIPVATLADKFVTKVSPWLIKVPPILEFPLCISALLLAPSLEVYSPVKVRRKACSDLRHQSFQMCGNLTVSPCVVKCSVRGLEYASRNTYLQVCDTRKIILVNTKVITSTSRKDREEAKGVI